MSADREHGGDGQATRTTLPAKSLAALGLAGMMAMGLLCWSAPHAAALTITNREAVEARLTIITGALRDSHAIAPGRVLKDVCPRGCIVRLADQSEWELSGTEVVSLEGSVVYYDGEEADPNAKAQQPNAASPQQRQPAPRRNPGGRAPL